MPMRNFHSLRIKNPSNYDHFTTKVTGKGIELILGWKGDKSEVQAVRFNKDSYTPEQAKAWVKDHPEYKKHISFHPAKKLEEDGETGTGTGQTPSLSTSTRTTDIAIYAPKIGDTIKRVDSKIKMKKIKEGNILDQLELIMEDYNPKFKHIEQYNDKNIFECLEGTNEGKYSVEWDGKQFDTITDAKIYIDTI